VAARWGDVIPPLFVAPTQHNYRTKFFITMSAPTVVHHNKLSEIYDKAAVQVPRYEALLKKFEERYGTKKPDLLIRSPGRVNVIGEHIDYCFFSVLPMAVEADIIMAIQLTDEPVIEVANTNPDFPATKFDLPKDGSPVEIDATKSDWANYFRCGLVVGQDYLKKNNYPCTKGIKVLIDGNVPTGSGLSSSAALWFVPLSALCWLTAIPMCPRNS
jgi:galactokinase